MRVHRFQSPFSHWVSGLFFELLAIAGFISLVAVIVALIVRVL